MGQLYLRQQRDGSLGGPWWIKYYPGPPGPRKHGTTDKVEARRHPKAKEGAVATGQLRPTRTDRVRYEEASTDLRSTTRRPNAGS